MRVDVVSEIEIDRPRDAVAAFAADPDNAPRWYANIKRITWKSAKELRVGARIEFAAEFLGRRLEYTYEVEELAPGERLAMATAEGPFPMRTTYTWADAPSGGTIMALRNSGSPTGFAAITAPVMKLAMRRENRKDLRRLKALLETHS